MKKRFIFTGILYIFCFVINSVFAYDEKTLLLGGSVSWDSAEIRNGITTAVGIRPNPVLLLCSEAGTSAGYSAAAGVSGTLRPVPQPILDLHLSFNERNVSLFRDSAGRYRVNAAYGLQTADGRFARSGDGAVLFSGSSSATASNASINSSRSSNGSNNRGLIIEPAGRDALFSSGNYIGDFSIEFWIYPLNLENGEQILSWTSSRLINRNSFIQQISCSVSRNRLNWSFSNFFASPNGTSHMNIEFSGVSAIIPRRWSHHLIRFDAVTGMIEYIIDGKSEAIHYATSTGRENSEVFIPVAGSNGSFVLGENFMGMMDDFKIHGAFTGRSSMDRYIASGGRMETRPIDLGSANSTVRRVNVTGGRVSINSGLNRVRNDNEFRSNGNFRFADDSQMQFFIRASENPWLLDRIAWRPFNPSVNINDSVRGRYVQIAVNFYPSADGNSSPYLDELRIVYISGDPPLPPSNLTASAADGGVYLSWRHSPDFNASGYLVYYSRVRGELFGEDAALGPSPIDVGRRTGVYIDGLQNGTLYYFRVAAYETIQGGEKHTGEFSREVTSRPLSGLMLTEIR